jgi:3-phenylpropionate/cinnamic acid dioxygenase small subunit
MDAADLLELLQLPARYGDTIDDAQYERLDRVFTADAVFDVNGTLHEGLEAIRHFVEVVARHPRCHLITNVRVDETDDGVVVSSRIVSVRPDGVRTGRYRDHVARGPDGWRITRKVFRPTPDATTAA